MQSVSSQKERGSPESAAERAGQTSTALLECEEGLKKGPVGHCLQFWQQPVPDS